MTTKSVLLVYSNCPPDREAAFNEWYDTIHLPDLLTVEGVIAARRFKLSGPGPTAIKRDGEQAVAQYLAMYELDSDDTRTLIRRISEASAGFWQQGRGSDDLQTVSAATYVALGDRMTR